MGDVVKFEAAHHRTARQNLQSFIDYCRFELDVFGSDLDWDSNHWPTAKVTFGREVETNDGWKVQGTLSDPIKEFAKAYLRYCHGLRPTKGRFELACVRCVERALVEMGSETCILRVDAPVLDLAADVARRAFCERRAFAIGRELMLLSKFLSEAGLVPGWIGWKNPNPYPVDKNLRTGKVGREAREARLPPEEAIKALADIYAFHANTARDVFTTSVAAIMLSAPFRISEVLLLHVDCEVWEKRRNGEYAYGLRIKAKKGGGWGVKWIPDVMAT